jgi:hypothetical protein
MTTSTGLGRPSAAVSASRPAVPEGPPKLTPAHLRAAQEQTLGAPRLHYSLLARALFKAMDIGYGRRSGPDRGSYAAEYGRYGSVADLLRQIGHDERIHKLDSLANMRAPRFRPGG